MGDKTKISWADATWNPVTGCSKVSPGCDHCYAESIAHRFAGRQEFPNGFAVTLRPEWLDRPLRWTRPRMVFAGSMCDLFHDQVPTEYLARVWGVMARATPHRFLLLTKRPGRMRSLTNSAEFREAVSREAGRLVEWPLPNVWLGTSAETQHWADVRVPVLLESPAPVHYVSCEPLLGPVSLQGWLHRPHCPGRRGVCVCGVGTGLDWVIVGGESGRGVARPMHPMWARELRAETVGAGAAFHFKQWGEWVENRRGRVLVLPDETPKTCALSYDGSAVTGPSADAPWKTGQAAGWTSMVRVGKASAGRELDGFTWDERPA